MRIVITSVLFIILCLGGFSCRRCGEDDVFLPYYSITNLKIAINLDSMYDGARNHLVDSPYILPWSQLLICPNSNVKYHASNELPFTFGSSAYACSVAMNGEKGSIEKMTELRITSDQDFDSTHIAGSLLNEFFVFSYAEFNFRPLSELTATFPADPNPGIMLKLQKKPQTGKCSFFIHYHMSNGKHFDASTPELTLN